MKKILSLVCGCLLATAAAAQDGDLDPNTMDASQQTSAPRQRTVIGAQNNNWEQDSDVTDFLRQIGSDTTYWRGNGAFSISGAQTNLTNWAAGGDKSIAGNTALTYSLDYEKDRSLWMNRLELGFGLSRTDANGTRKTTDRIYLNSIYGYEVVEHWYASFFVNFQSQFAKGYNYAVSKTDYISRFLAPGYLSLGPGITWMPKPWFVATFSPASWRGTFVQDKKLSQRGAYGVKPGKRLHSEFGANLKLVARFNPLPNVSVYSRLDLFSNYLDKPQNVDVHWDTIVTMNINKWLSANLTVNMIYDDNVRFVWEQGGKAVPALQLKEVLGLGFMASF